MRRRHQDRACGSRNKCRCASSSESPLDVRPAAHRSPPLSRNVRAGDKSDAGLLFGGGAPTRPRVRPGLTAQRLSAPRTQEATKLASIKTSCARARKRRAPPLRVLSHYLRLRRLRTMTSHSRLGASEDAMRMQTSQSSPLLVLLVRTAHALRTRYTVSTVSTPIANIGRTERRRRQR